MPALKRFGVSMEESLLNEFDKYLTRKKYSNRSEAIRDMVRKQLAEEDWSHVNVKVAATISIVYNHHKHELLDKITNLQHRYLKIIISSVHVHLDKSHCLEVLIVRGKAGEIQELADQLSAIKGVLFRNFNFASGDRNINSYS